MSEPVLELQDVTVDFSSSNGYVRVVDGVSYTVCRGEIFGVAGESGSGKTVSMLATMGLLPRDASIGGRAMFQGHDLLSYKKEEVRELCGSQIAMVFQDPMSSLHPMLTVGEQLTDHMRTHLGVGKRAARARAVELLESVRIPGPKVALDSFPHHFSGGMRQRIAIAIALACEPKLLIADEPTTALDVTVQAGIVRLLDRLRKEIGLSIVLITHNLALLATVADKVAVFYSGRIIEAGTVAQVMTTPRHPYTLGLVDALPHSDKSYDNRPLIPIAGFPPPPQARPAGCAFHPRCGFAHEGCAAAVPSLRDVGGEHLLACPVDPRKAR